MQHLKKAGTKNYSRTPKAPPDKRCFFVLLVNNLLAKCYILLLIQTKIDNFVSINGKGKADNQQSIEY